MGRRSRRFKCKDESCQRLFWVKFEHYSMSALEELAETLTCAHCGSDDWETTEETAWGGVEQAEMHGFYCRDCMCEFYKPMHRLSPSELVDIAQNTVCPECNSADNLKLSDSAKRKDHL